MRTRKHRTDKREKNISLLPWMRQKEYRKTANRHTHTAHEMRVNNSLIKVTTTFDFDVSHRLNTSVAAVAVAAVNNNTQAALWQQRRWTPHHIRSTANNKKNVNKSNSKTGMEIAEWMRWYELARSKPIIQVNWIPTMKTQFNARFYRWMCVCVWHIVCMCALDSARFHHNNRVLCEIESFEWHRYVVRTQRSEYDDHAQCKAFIWCYLLSRAVVVRIKWRMRACVCECVNMTSILFFITKANNARIYLRIFNMQAHVSFVADNVLNSLWLKMWIEWIISLYASQRAPNIN